MGSHTAGLQIVTVDTARGRDRATGGGGRDPQVADRSK